MSKSVKSWKNPFLMLGKTALTKHAKLRASRWQNGVEVRVQKVKPGSSFLKQYYRCAPTDRLLLTNCTIHFGFHSQSHTVAYFCLFYLFKVEILSIRTVSFCAHENVCTYPDMLKMHANNCVLCKKVDLRILSVFNFTEINKRFICSQKRTKADENV